MRERALDAAGEVPLWPEALLARKVVRLAESLQPISGQVGAFRHCYEGRIRELNASGLASACAEFENFLAPLQRATTSAEALLAVNADERQGAALLDSCDQAWQVVAEAADIFEREIAAIPPLVAEKLFADPQLLEYSNYLDKIRDNAKLLPPAEIAGVAAQLDSSSAWEALARQLLARITVAYEDLRLSLGEALPTLYHPDKVRRREMCAVISAELAGEAELRATALVMLTHARYAYQSACGVEDWLSPTYVANQVTAAEVGTLIEVVRGHQAIVHAYYQDKAVFQGVSLTEADRYAPIAADIPPVTWQDARDIVLTAFSRLGPATERLARELLDRDAVDALPRPGKRRGALTFTLPGGEALVLLNFTQTPRDVMTLGHELGHAVHGCLAGSKGVLGAAVPTVVAETVGLFTEMLTAEVYAQQISDSSQRQALQARWVEDQLTAVFRQLALHDFEAALYAAARDGSQLGSESLGDMWLAQQSALYGPAVTLGPGYRHWWSYLDNFFFDPGSRYAYAYGQLAASGLLARYSESPGPWCRRFGEMLQAGGTRRPSDLLASLGVRSTGEADWLVAMQVLASQASGVFGDTSGYVQLPDTGTCHSGKPSGEPIGEGR